jgi:hypothetical protein
VSLLADQDRPYWPDSAKSGAITNKEVVGLRTVEITASPGDKCEAVMERGRN